MALNTEHCRLSALTGEVIHSFSYLHVAKKRKKDEWPPEVQRLRAPQPFFDCLDSHSADSGTLMDYTSCAARRGVKPLIFRTRAL